MGLDGNLEDFPLADVLQLINMGSRTGLLAITDKDNTARIWFERGQAVHAEVGEQEGEKAVYETFNWREGRFTFDTDAKTERRSIDLDCQNLIMEAVRRLDEWTKLRKVIPSSDYVVAFAAGPGEKAGNITLQAHEWKVLSLVNGELRLAELAEKTGFSELKTTQIVFTLIESGLLEVHPSGAKPAAPPGEEEPHVKSLREFLKGVEQPAEIRETTATVSAAKTNVGVLALFINTLLDNFENPNGLYNAVKQERPLRERIAEQAERYPQVEIIKFADDRVDIERLDQDIETLDDLGKKNLIVALAEVKEQIFHTAEAQSNKIAASRRHNKVLEQLFGTNGTPQDLGLGSILERKTQ
ncbi:MAG: DUF4388 domain-containing protein [Candidatus Coatesbacteria bacterium]|nr:MAG: DUF4388 domain-containing protein [Candidatus Coatesbacteria bacterium]